MSKEQWIKAHERAIEEAMEADPSLDWSTAYESESVAKRADEICRDRYAAAIDEIRQREKYKD